ncbi:MAG: DUF6883 domain-containing protein [Solirubrobacteraceae bacterium]
MSPAAEDHRLRIGDPLPRAGEAIISVRKLRDYALNPDHPQGGPKARVFAAVLHLMTAWQLVGGRPRLVTVYVDFDASPS